MKNFFFVHSNKKRRKKTKQTKKKTMVDSWFLKNNNALGTVLYAMSIVALLIAIVAVSEPHLFVFALTVGMTLALAATYYWLPFSNLFSPKNP